MKSSQRPAYFISVTAIGIAASILFASQSFAQTNPGQANKDTNTYSNSPKKKGKEHTLSFEDELVEGANSKPELFYLFQKKKFNYKRLIKLRENFLPEMKKTSEEIQRSRSQY